MFKILLIVSLFLNLNPCSAELLELHKKPDPDEFISTPELIRSKGYPAEEHLVTTQDGYKLEIHRIPYGRDASTKNQVKKVALLQHGLLDSSTTWVMNFPHQSLGYILADAGYDVWLGNVRGNTYALNHVKLNKSEDEFWNFSWSEMAKYDLPAMINYVLNETGQEQLYYIGHSQGSLIGFAEFGQNQELASKIKLFIALGPVATTQNIISPIRYLAYLGEKSNQEIFYRIFGRKDFLPVKSIYFFYIT
jgi:pimeloyl-ACP methyl ester carboxylesterase